MASYQLAYDGEWRERFANEPRALAFGQELAEETDRLVFVVRRGLFRSRLLAVYPESRNDEGKWLWKVRAAGAAYGGGHSP